MAGDCYITTVKDFTFVNGKKRIEYIFNNKVYGFGDGARGLSNLKKDDKICFYLPAIKSVVLQGVISNGPEIGSPPKEWNMYNKEGLEYYDTEVELKNLEYVYPPVKMSDVYDELGLPEKWGNYVRQTHKVSPSEFNILIGLE